MSRKILVILTTGRLSFGKVCEKLKENATNSAMNNEKVDLIINFDPTFSGKSRADFEKIDVSPLLSTGEVFFAGDDFIDQLDWLKPEDKEKLKIVSPVTGYGQKKNACLLYGMHHQYDMVLFWDDDEYPISVEYDNGILLWNHTDIISNHLNCDTQVSFGFWTGYVSPIPDSFFIEVSDKVKQKMTEAFRQITDVVFEKTFYNRSATYYILDRDRFKEKEIKIEDGGKLISGGNLAFHLYKGMGKNIPAFFTPKDSRGDDSILSMGLLDVSVHQVNSGIFHDAFNLFNVDDFDVPYNEIKDRLKVNDGKERFANVLRGWIAYAPMLSYFRFGESFREYIQESVSILKEVDDAIMNYFGESWNWDDPSQLLEQYNNQVDDEIEKYNNTQNYWKQLRDEYYR